MKRQLSIIFNIILLIIFAAGSIYLAGKVNGRDLDNLDARLNLASLIVSIALTFTCLVVLVSVKLWVKVTYFRIIRYIIYSITFAIAVTCFYGVEDNRELFRLCLLAWIFVFTVLEIFRTDYLTSFLKGRLNDISKLVDILCFNIVLLVILLEAVLRIFSIFSNSVIFNPPNIKAKQRIERNKLRAGEMHSGFPANSLGFYDQEFINEKSADTFRILALTDSFGVEAVSYDKNFLTILENYNISQGEIVKGIEVLNCGIDELSPEGYLYLNDKMSPIYKPDLTMVCIFIGNDITGLPEKEAALAFLDKDYWYSYFVIERYLILLKEQGAKKSQDEHPVKSNTESSSMPVITVSDKPTFSKDAFLNIEKKRMDVCLKQYNKSLNYKWERLKEIMLEINMKNNGKVLFVLIPDEFQVNDTLWAELYADNVHKEDEYDRFYPQKHLAKFCKSNKLRVLDLLAGMREVEKTGRTYKLQDTHWSVYGHITAAKLIQRYINQKKSEN
ncbi:MAG: hypothetical protein ACYTFY_15140 [Planctomycetota bacterium]|jgi:hypothetical protein